MLDNLDQRPKLLILVVFLGLACPANNCERRTFDPKVFKE